jgi:hypothetical protein
MADGTACNDQNACSPTSTCQLGNCIGQSPKVCNDGNACTSDSCNTTTGACVFTAQSGTACSDGNACTGADLCQAGACKAGGQKVCNDGNVCSADSCDQASGLCTFTPIAGCGGNCATDLDCPSTGNFCTTEVCNLKLKQCIVQAVPNGSACDDGVACTVNDVCKNGACSSGGIKACTDGNPCTADVCKSGACGSAPLADGMACDDGVECTTGDVCNLGQCKGKSPAPADVMYGGPATDRAGAVAALADGFVLAGLTSSQGAGDSDALLVRTDMDGKSLWQKTFGGKSDDRAFAVVAAGNGIAWTGFTVSQGAGNADAWLMRIDGSGNPVWEKVFGGEQFDATYGLAALKDGGLALAGFTYSYGAGLSDAWLLRTDANGKMLWSKTFGGVGEDGAYAVVALPDNGLALAGVTDPGNGFHDAWLLRTDATGKLLWSQSFGDMGNDDASALVALSDGFALAGYTTAAGGDKDAWLVRTDAAGKQLWTQTFGGISDDVAHGLTTLPGGGFALAGATASQGAGGTDAWLIRTDATGKSLTQQTIGGPLDDVALGVVNTGGGVVLAGARGKTLIDVDAWWALVPAACQ